VNLGQTVIGEAEVLRRLAEVQSLPALPTVVRAATARMADPRSSAGEVGRLLAHDQALTARVLRLANSAFYSPREPVRSPEHAVVLMGLGTVRAIVLKASIFSAFDLASARPFWLHALGTGCAATALARMTGVCPAEDAFVVGLLHDLGKLALRRHLPDLDALVKARLAQDGGLVRDAEQAVLGCDHATIGGYLCTHWSLPAEYRAAIAGHHNLALAAPEHRSWAALVHLADILARAMLIGNGGDHAMPTVLPQALELLQLDERHFRRAFAATEDELSRAEVFFTILVDG
jgi:putative nucleotidyltransferase with HDIG domain